MEKGSGSPFDIMCATVRADATGSSVCMCPRVSSFVCQPHSNPGSMTTLSCPCCVGKGIHQVVPPSRYHAAAEAAFGDAVAKEVSRLGFTRLMCDAVQALDDQVQRGFVRRQAAARMASSGCVFGTGARHQYDSTLLRCVLQPYKHKTSDCKCLETVLAWGCCPTLLGYGKGSGVLYQSALFEALRCGRHGDMEKPWVRTLLSWGSIPCVWYRIVGDSKRRGATLAPVSDMSGWFGLKLFKDKETGAGPTMSAVRHQWHRWHQRAQKRRWIAAALLL